MKNITPDKFRCPMGDCPAIYRDGEDYVIRGKLIKSGLTETDQEPGIQAEADIRIPAKLIDGALRLDELIEAATSLLNWKTVVEIQAPELGDLLREFCRLEAALANRQER